MSSRRTEPGIVRAFCAGRDLLGRYPQSLLGLAFRFAIAVVFWRSGMTKIASWDVTLNLFQYEYAVPLLPPEIAAYMAAAAELSCPVLLVFGLGTRFAAAALLGMTAVIQIFVYPASWPDHLLWGSILVYLLTRGGGLLSLDHLVSHRFMRTADQRR
ncbi:MAG: DoxX family protein [Rhodospirillales bacterium]|nr:DoxX family protein [Rhodospirillales bacterium]